MEWGLMLSVGMKVPALYWTFSDTVRPQCETLDDLLQPGKRANL